MTPNEPAGRDASGGFHFRITSRERDMRRHLFALLPLTFVLLPACNRQAPSTPPATDKPAAAIVEPSGSMPGEPEVAPPPRLIPPAAEAVNDPDDAMQVFAGAAPKGVWKFQHPEGKRETNELHLPVGRPVQFVLSAEDDAVSPAGWRHLEIPAFPLAAHAWANRYSKAAVKPTRTGSFGLWDAGQRVGTVFVVEAAAYDRWLEGEPKEMPKDGTLAYEGRQLFLKLQCIRCHSATPTGKAPVLEGLYGTKVPLKGGGTAVVDDAYIIESIRKPKVKVVEGWETIMPAYDKDSASDEDVKALVAFIRSLKKGGEK